MDIHVDVEVDVDIDRYFVRLGSLHRQHLGLTGLRTWVLKGPSI